MSLNNTENDHKILPYLIGISTFKRGIRKRLGIVALA